MSLIEVHIFKVSTAGNRLRWFTFADKIDSHNFQCSCSSMHLRIRTKLEMKLPLTWKKKEREEKRRITTTKGNNIPDQCQFVFHKISSAAFAVERRCSWVNEVLHAFVFTDAIQANLHLVLQSITHLNEVLNCMHASRSFFGTFQSPKFVLIWIDGDARLSVRFKRSNFVIMFSKVQKRFSEI